MNKHLALQLLLKLGQTPNNAPMTERTLFKEVNLFLTEPESSGEMHEAMNWLKSKGWVDFEVDDFVGRKWWITSTGNVRMRETGL